jgi:YHS domain-containing protein
VLRFLLLSILLLLVARAFWRLMDGVIEAAGGTSRRRAGGNRAAVKLVRDPICGTFVAPANALSTTAGDTTHYFCSEKCRSEFGKGSR